MNDTNNVGVNSTSVTNNVPNTPVVPVAPVGISQVPPVTVTTQPVVNNASPVVPNMQVLNNPMAEANNINPVSVSSPVTATPNVATQVVPVAQTSNVVTPVAPVVNNSVVQANPTVVNASPTPVTPAVSAQNVVTPIAPTTPVAPVVPPVTPAPVNQSGESKVEVQLADNIKIESEKKKVKDKKKKEKSNSDADDEEDTDIKANRYPIALAIVFVSLLLLMFVYYYLVMTPFNVFSSALDSMVDSIVSAADSFGNGESDRSTYDLQFDLQTDTEQFTNNKEQTPIDYINGDHIEGIVYFDNKSNGVSLNLLADKAEKNLPEGVTLVDKKKNLENMLDLRFYLYEDNMYIGPIYYIDYNDPDAASKAPITIDKTVQINATTEIAGKTINFDNLSTDSFKDMAEFIRLVIEKGKTTVEDSDLKRGIVFKKVGDSTAIALKANCDTNEDMIKRVYYGTFDDEFINRSEVIKLVEGAFGFSEDEAKELLEELHTHPTDFERLDINLYMNLANTELISFDMTFDDDYYIQLDYLKGFYSLTFRIMTDGNEDNDSFNIKATYDTANGIVDGLGVINNDNTLLAVKFDYTRKVSSTGEKAGNSLNFKFYNNRTYKEVDDANQKPFCKLDCTLDVYESNNDPSGKTNFNLKEELKNPYILPVSQYKTSSGLIIKSTMENVEKISVQEGLSIINFEKGFVSHVQFLIDHLLYNKEGAIARRDANSEEEVVENKTNETDENQTVEESTQSTQTVESSETVEETTTEE